MVRVVHSVDPEDAGHRLREMGVSPDGANPILQNFRGLLLFVPEQYPGSSTIPGILSHAGIPFARGEQGLCFSVSPQERVGGWGNDFPGAEAALRAVREALARYATREFTLSFRDRSLRLSGVPRIMGVLNVTPDSFSDGGKFATRESAVLRGLQMAQEGADILDVGGESTRPGSKGVPLEVERDRVIPVIRELAGKTDALLSVDTTKAAVAREAAEAGAHIINDTSALADDPEMATVVRETGCAVVLMHRRGTPATMQEAPSYRFLFDELLAELEERVEHAAAAGIPRDRILVDPGVGFGKRLTDNLALHRHLPELRNLGLPILFGPSRKAFLGAITGKDADERLSGTAAAVALAVAGGAHVVRVHDVPEMRDVVRVAAEIAGQG